MNGNSVNGGNPQESLGSEISFETTVERPDGQAIAKGLLTLRDVPRQCGLSPESERHLWDTRLYPEVYARGPKGRIRLIDWHSCPDCMVDSGQHFHARLEDGTKAADLV